MPVNAVVENVFGTMGKTPHPRPSYIDCPISHRNHILDRATDPPDLEKLAYKVNRGSLALARVCLAAPPLPFAR